MSAAFDMLESWAPTDPVRVHRPYSDLPRRSVAQPYRRRAHAKPEPAPARVLVAEDDPAMRQMLVEALREAGYQVIEVANGRQLAKCLSGPKGQSCPVPDLVISDVRMPGHTGLDVLAALREEDWAMPVIIITAFGDGQTHAEAYRLGAARVFDKPFDVDDLLYAARNIVPPVL